MRGFLPPMIALLAVFLFLMVLPIILIWVFPTFEWILKVYFSIMVYFFVRRILGSGLLTYVVAGILIYIFVFQLFYLFTMGYVLYLIVGLGLSGIIVFGLPSGGIGRKAGAAR